jgi:SAM-dependent methyltransferase
MNLDTYRIEHEIQRKHWWFVGRRKLFSNLIAKLDLKKDATIVDIGCSSGTNLRMLKEMGYTNYVGLDFSEAAKEYSELEGLGNVFVADIEKDKMGDNLYDLILLTDILEHLRNDEAAIQKCYNALKPKGYLFITVPCFKTLWGPQDELSHHLRRYNKKELENKIINQCFFVKKTFYFNAILFIPIYVMRKILMLTNKIVNENTINNKLLNWFFTKVFLLDCILAEKINFPFGVSCLILAQKS